jgi:hypothetical protein
MITYSLLETIPSECSFCGKEGGINHVCEVLALQLELRDRATCVAMDLTIIFFSYMFLREQQYVSVSYSLLFIYLFFFDKQINPYLLKSN